MPSAPRTPNPLFVAELFDAILDRLAEPSRSKPNHYDRGIRIRTPDQEGRRALAVLARTCRGLSEPSLDYLWRKLNSLEPLFQCFASKASVLLLRRGLARPPSLADWLVINRYSHRIQELEVQNDSSSTFLGHIIFESELLPNLRVLKWNTRKNFNPIGIAYIQPLLVPGLVALDVGATEHDMAIASFLKTFPSRCPALTTLGLYLNLNTGESIGTLSFALYSFKNLKCLTLEPPVNDRALQQLLMSTKLQELTLQLREFPLAPSDIPLRNVKKLNLMLKDLHPITELLRPGDQNFHEITFYLHRIESAENIGSFISKLASYPEKSPLQSLHLINTESYPFVNECESFVLSFDTFRPLTSLTNLRELSIRLENPIVLSDEELADLAHNWPLLQVIELCHGCRFRAKRITFKGLQSLVTICPKLRAVGLTLDGRNVPSGVAAGLRCNAITALRFPNSPIDNPRLVAKFLLTHFPSVTSTSISQKNKWGLPVVVDRQPRHHDGKAWAEVGSYLADASKLDSAELGVDDS